MINLLLKKPHSTEYVHDAVMDADVYELLISDGWNFAINEAQPNRPYIKIYRRTESRLQQLWLHRWIAMGHMRIGHSLQVHHANHNSMDNRCDNLQPLPPSRHKQLHVRSRRAA